jgi:hypothetical protein
LPRSRNILESKLCRKGKESDRISMRQEGTQGALPSSCPHYIFLFYHAWQEQAEKEVGGPFQFCVALLSLCLLLWKP